MKLSELEHGGAKRVAMRHEICAQRPRPESKPPAKLTRQTLREMLAIYERSVLLQTLRLNGFSREQAARALGITRQHLWRRMRDLKIDFSAIPRTTGGGGPPRNRERLTPTP